jgi:hypothetical protein
MTRPIDPAPAPPESPTDAAEMQRFRERLRDPNTTGLGLIVVVASVVGGLGFLLVALIVGVAMCGGAPGRPLRIGGLRVLPLVRRARARRARSRGADEPDVDSLSREARRALAKRWLADARAEYASIEAFEGLARELAAAGAPATLVDGARRAAREEAGHATMCFAVASAYAGHELTARPFPAWWSTLRAGSRRLGSRKKRIERLAVESLVEGCVEEGLAADEARAASRRASDPVIAGVLARIAVEEASHAELASGIVDWAVRVEPEVALALGPALERARGRRRAV